MKRKIIIVATFIVISLLTTVTWHAISYQEKIFAGISINDVYVGGLTPKEAITKIKDLPPPPKRITLHHEDFSEEIDLGDYKANIDYEDSVKNALLIGRRGGFTQNLKKIASLRLQNENILIEVKIDEKSLRRKIENIASIIDRPPVDAVLLISRDRIRIDEGQIGIKIDVLASIERIKTTLSKGEKEVALKTETKKQEKTESDIRSLRIEKLIGEFTTKFDPRQKSRIENIALASRKIDNHYISPTEIFSFIGSVGPVTATSGYKDATVIENGELVQGIGGGICQVATTLYNTYMLAGLPTIERKIHSNFIAAYPIGRDAGVAEGIFDLRFRNGTDGHILIISEVNDDSLTIRLYGPDTGRINTFTKPIISDFVPYKVVLEADNSLPVGVKIVAQKGIAGRSVKVNRLVSIGDDEHLEEVIESRYLPRNEIIKVGPSPSTSTTP